MCDQFDQLFISLQVTIAEPDMVGEVSKLLA